MRKLFFLCMLSISISGCGEMLTAMSQANQDMGSRCRSYTSAFYVESNGEWLEDQAKFKSKAGEDVSYEEKNWLRNRASYYINRRQFQTYYVTSPYTGADYKFNVHCAQWY